MGKYWLLFNLDESEYAECGGAKFREFFYNASEDFTLNLLLSSQPKHNAWGGDRIILLGDHSRALPPNVITDNDSDLLKKCANTDEPKLRAYAKLANHGRERNTIPTPPLASLRTLCTFCAATTRRNMCATMSRDHRHISRMTTGLAQALFTLVGWSEDPSASLWYDKEDYVPDSGGTTVPLHRGAWAGDRIDIVALTDEVEKDLHEEGWTDISTEKARHVSDVYACDPCMHL